MDVDAMDEDDTDEDEDALLFREDVDFAEDFEDEDADENLNLLKLDESAPKTTRMDANLSDTDLKLNATPVENEDTTPTNAGTILGTTLTKTKLWTATCDEK